ncbi:MAG: (d)CMP kinase [Planctomycetota bacterium]
MTLEVVAIDGPSGSGKSTLARRLAAALGWRHLDTGAMYRAATLAVLRAKVRPDDEAAVVALVEARRIELPDVGGVLLDGEDVAGAIRGPDVDAAVSAVSALAGVRARMVELQRAQAARGPLVAEGRDMTTVVFPDARWRFYLDADVAERARRRQRDWRAAGAEREAAEVARDLERRDRLDSTRPLSPLRLAEGVRRIDTTALDADQVLQVVLDAVRGERGCT